MHRENAVVDDEVEALGKPRELVLLLRPDVERNANFAGRARRDRADRNDHPRRVEAAVELPRVELARRLLVVARQPCGDEVVLHHRDPAVVGVLGVRKLPGRVGRELVELAEFDLLELVGLVVDDRAGKRHRGHRVVRALRLRIARELVVGKRRDGRGAGIRDVVGDIDHVRAAMERQHLHDPIAVRRHRLQLEIDPIGAGRELARTRLGGVDGAMVRHALARGDPDCATNVRSGVLSSAR